MCVYIYIKLLIISSSISNYQLNCVQYFLGDSQLSIAFGFMVGIATVSKIVREGCIALWKALSPTYLKAPTIENAWREVASEFYSG